MIAITFALPSESAALVRHLAQSAKRSGRRDQVIRGRICNRDVVILHTGVGRAACRPRVAAFLHREQPNLLISAGFGGATRDGLQVADIVIGENFSDPALASQTLTILKRQPARLAKIFTAETVIDSFEERNAIAAAHNADVVEMETAVIAEACKVENIPLLSLRAISDTPSRPFPAPPAVLFDLNRQKTDLRRLGMYLLGHPAAIAGLLAFAGRVRLARNRLAQAILQLLPQIIP